MRAEIKGIESRKIIEKNQQNQNRFFDKINNIDRLLARLKNLKNGEEKWSVSGVKQRILLQTLQTSEGQQRNTTRSSAQFSNFDEANQVFENYKLPSSPNIKSK